MVLAETLTETLPAGTDELDRVSLIALEDFLPYPVGEGEAEAEHYVEEKKPHRLTTIDDYSQIYCTGDLLQRVQLSRVFPNDSKEFVDLKLLRPQEDVLRDYNQLLERVPQPDVQTLRDFVNYHFEKGDELEVWSPPDFTKTPSITYKIADPKYKKFALDLNNIWKELGRKVKEDVKINSGLYSIIYTPNGFFIPGGRFLELYYWDTYWIVQGVLLCDMKQTAKGIIENIIYIVDHVGFMPNGARIYYLHRSQPPMLSSMVSSYVKYTGDFGFIKANIQILRREFEYWMDNHMVTVEVDGHYYRVARYYAPSAGPRPESFREDYELAEHFETEEQKNNLYVELKSGAETGWDFSSRWFIPEDGSNNGNLSDIKTSQIACVDLTALLQKNAKDLYEWYKLLGNRELSDKYGKIAEELLVSIEKVMWNEEAGVWFDYDIVNKRQRKYFYLSNFTPLWTLSYRQSGSKIAERVLSYLRANGIIPIDGNNKLYGTPQSLYETGQQWDYPNAWAPSQEFLITGLELTGDRAAQNVARALSDRWVYTCYRGLQESAAMFEKYDVEKPGLTGGGGEYAAQTGFGWTNGLTLQLLSRYGRTLSPTNRYNSEEYADPVEDNFIPDA